MTLFWILAAALVVAVLLGLVRPLLRAAAPSPAARADAQAASNLRILREQRAEIEAERAAGTLDEAQYVAARAELERRVLDEAAPAAPAGAMTTGGRLSALALAVALPAIAVLLYAQLGNRDAFDPILSKPANQATVADVEVLVERLAERMAQNPGDPEGWVLLARSYASMGRFEQARDAYARAVALVPGNPHLLADYADSLAMTQGRSLQGEPERLVQEALKADPDHLKALALAGSAAMERGDAAAAVRYWSHIREVAAPDNPFVAGLAESLREARAAAGLPPETPAVAAASAAAGTPGARLAVTVTLDPALAGRLQPGDTLFVFARAAEGPRMPLAIARLPAAAGPQQVVLDDSMAMSPQLTLSRFPQVVVGARISRSGNATPQPGDLEGQGAPQAPSGEAAVTIDHVRE